MSVEFVLLPVFVLVGLTFALLLGMASARGRALSGRQVGFKDIALGQANGPPAPPRSAIASATSSKFRSCSTS